MAVATVDIQINSQGAVRSLNQVDVASRNTQSALQKLDGVVGSLAASFAAGFAINKVINDVKELDTNIRRLGTVGVDVAKINPALSALSDRLGGVANKAELAAASYQAASAGFSDTAGNIRILEAATKAATGGLADNQGVTEVLVKTLNAYGMSGTQAYQVTDSISKAVELGNQEWSDYVSQLGRVASVAALAGVSLDEVNAFIASATKNGATAEVAFTGLSGALNSILQPTKESQKAAAALGIQWNIVGLETKGLAGLLAELAKKQDRNKGAAIELVGSQEALRGVFAANAKGGKDFEMILNQLSNAAGKTDADFQTMKGSLENTFKALDTSFKNLSEALGKAFGPTLVITIQDITKGVNGFASAMSAIPQPVMNATGEIVKIIVQMILLQKAIQGIIALRAAYVVAMGSMATSTAAAGVAATTSSSAFALYTRNTKTLETAAAASTGRLTGLLGVLSRLAAIGVIAIAVNIAVNGVQSLVSAMTEINKLRGRKAAGGAAAMFAGSTKEEVIRQQAIARQVIKNERKTVQELTSIGNRAIQNANIGGILNAFGANLPTISSANERQMQANARIGSAQAVLGLDPTKFKGAVTSTTQDTTQASIPYDPDSGKDKKKKAKKERESELAQIQAANGLFASQEVIKARIAKAEYDQNQLEVMRLQMVGRGVELLAEAAAIQREKIPQDEKDAKMLGVRNGLIASENQYQREIAQNIKQQQEPLNAIILANKTKLEDDKAYQRLIAEGINPEIAKQYVEIDRAGKALQKSLEPAVGLAKAALAEAEARGLSADQVERLKKELEELQKLPGKKVEEAKGTVVPEAPKSFKESVTGERDKIKKELDELTKASNLVAFGAKAIGDSFANSFKGIISGSMGAKEALSSFFKGIADAFLDMAAQIIAKWITMTILNSVLSLFPGGGGGKGGGGLGKLPMDDISRYAVPLPGFADGGYVNGPTTAMIGEGGQPEYVIPASKMRESMSRYAAGARGSAVIGNGTSDGDLGGGAATMNGSTIDVRYTVERINSVDYVTASQFQQGMQKAAMEGAQRGQQATLRRLQNSSSTRRSVGI